MRRRFSQKRKDKFDLLAVKSKKANKTNLFVHFLGESMARQSAFGLSDLYLMPDIIRCDLHIFYPLFKGQFHLLSDFS